MRKITRWYFGIIALFFIFASASSANCAVVALKDIYVETSCQTSSVIANAGWKTVYSKSIYVKAGDWLRIHGQAELTNNSSIARINIRLGLENEYIGAIQAQNVDQGTSHHMPLWTDGIYYVTLDRPVLITVLVSASSSNSNALEVEQGYGQLIIEHYREYPNIQEAVIDKAYLLEDFSVDTINSISSFGSTAGARTVAYNLILNPVDTSNLIRLMGQATSSYNGSIQMHGQAIYINNALAFRDNIGANSTENIYWDVSCQSLFSNAVHRPETPGSYNYLLAMFGVLDVKTNILSGRGHLYAMRFAKAQNTTYAGKYAYGEGRTVALASNRPIVANSEWKEILTLDLPSLSANDILRINGFAEFMYPSNFTLGISCRAKVELWEGDTIVATSTISQKYITQTIAALPLRTEMLFKIPTTGDYQLRLSVIASRSGAKPTLTIRCGDYTKLLVDEYKIISQ